MGSAWSLVSRRIAAIYSAMVSGEPVPPALLWLPTRVDRLRVGLQKRLPAISRTGTIGAPTFPTGDQPLPPGYRPPITHMMDSPHPATVTVIGPSLPTPKAWPKALGVRRYTIFTAACALLVR